MSSSLIGFVCLVILLFLELLGSFTPLNRFELRVNCNPTVIEIRKGNLER